MWNKLAAGSGVISMDGTQQLDMPDGSPCVYNFILFSG